MSQQPPESPPGGDDPSQDRSTQPYTNQPYPGQQYTNQPYPPADAQAPDQGYAQAEYPHGYADPNAPASYPAQPAYVDGSQVVEPGAAPPGSGAGQPQGSPDQPHRRSPVVAPLLALIGLVLVAVVSIAGINYIGSALPDAAAAEATSAPGDPLVALASSDPIVPTASPTDVGSASEPMASPGAIESPAATEQDSLEPDAPLVIDTQTADAPTVKGTILFTRGGDIWAASGRQLRRLTDTASTKSDSSPVWAPDGKTIYYIRESKRVTENAKPGGKYTLQPTDLMKMKADGSNKKVVYQSLHPARNWFTHVLQPSVSANDKTVAVVSDGPDGSGPVVLHVVNANTGRISKVPVSSNRDLGHNDPAFSPDGTRIAYTYNNNAGTNGVPRIGIHTCQSRANCTQGRAKLLKPGFASPSWSPDGKLLVVEATTGKGRDVAIVTTRRGDVRVQLTDDGNSFAPMWSPDGDQIAYLHRDGTDIDLRVMSLDIDERGKITLLEDRAVTSDGGVDARSGPSWHVPRSERTNVDLAPEPSGEPVAEETFGPDEDPTSEGAPPPPGT